MNKLHIKYRLPDGTEVKKTIEVTKRYESDWEIDYLHIGSCQRKLADEFIVDFLYEELDIDYEWELDKE